MNWNIKRRNSKSSAEEHNGLATFSKLLLWTLFALNVVYLLFHFPSIPEYKYQNLIKINGFTVLMWATVSFFSAVVSTYSYRYLQGFKFRKQFVLQALTFTFSVMLLVASNHIVLSVISWAVMGLAMSNLIGIDRTVKEAKEAKKYTRKYFMAGTFSLALGLSVLSIFTGEITISGLTENAAELPWYVAWISSLGILLAAIIQAAMYPFHRWLLSAMTAPTPASALMHAGFVNGGAILLALFSPLIFVSGMLTTLFIIGGLTAVLAQFAKLLQVNVKHKLAASTIAQMGFMIMQCGLGFFNAAIAHLILHGFYKAYLFLSSGEEVAQSNPNQQQKIRMKPLQAIPVLILGILGAKLFLEWTGKGMHLDSGLFLTLIVAITVGQASYNIIKSKSLPDLHRFLHPPLYFILGIGLYALMYNGVTAVMADMPFIHEPTTLTGVQITFGMLFLLGFFIMKLEVYKRIPWLYVKLMNLTQPYKKVVLFHKTSK